MILCHPISGGARSTEAPTVIFAEADSPDIRICRRREAGFEIGILSGMDQTLQLPVA